MITSLLSTLLLLQASPQYALASTSGDTRLPQDPICRDEALLRRDLDDAWSRVHTPQLAWMALTGDLDGDGLFDHPAGVDALATRDPAPGVTPGPWDLLFSSDRDFGSFEDGDVLRCGPAGLEVAHTEAQLLLALQTAEAVDVDALAVHPGGALWLSLRDGLSVSVVGPVEDGDVLAWDVAAGTLTRVHAEADVQAMVTAATGSVVSVGDLKSLSFHPGTGEMLFTVQAPTDRDATVFGAAGGGRIVPHWEEADWQFQQSTELDALAFVDASWAQPLVLTTDVPYYAPGEDALLRLRHGEPGTRVNGIAADAARPRSGAWPGWGLVLPDPAAGRERAWPAPGAPPLVLDGSGSAGIRIPLQVPASATPLELWLQARGEVDGMSTPVRIRVE